MEASRRNERSIDIKVLHAQERDTVPLTLHHVPIRLEPSAHRHPSQRESGVKAVAVCPTWAMMAGQMNMALEKKSGN